MSDAYKEHFEKRGFELKRVIGNGLSGRTMEGYQKTLKRPVAVKFFDSFVNQNNNDLRNKFLREALLIAEVQHPSIPYVITNGSIINDNNNIPYIIMQFISGITLDEFIKKYKNCNIETVFSISSQVLDALKFVHKKNIIHRDIKPSNIMIMPSNHCYLIDFSIGFKEYPEEDISRYTRTGDSLGSIKYMSPEQKEDMKSVDCRSDIYSFSLVLCELLTGTPDPLSLDKLNLPSDLTNLIKKGCAYKKEDRFSNANEFLSELNQIQLKGAPKGVQKPARAICVNTSCPAASWSPNGYYRGANYIPDSTTVYCTSCGDKLVYQCSGCDSPIDMNKFCGDCGTKQFEVPECKQCGSFLQKNEMDSDTEKDGCEKCRRKKKEAEMLIKKPQDFSNFDDDIPF